MYRRYGTAEEKARVASHYERPAEFFYPILGDPWHVYSGLVWERATTVAMAQEEKLELLAGLMRLRPSMRILDVGCGWGGPLAYFCARYGTSGVGLTVAEAQCRGANERFARDRVDATAFAKHWDEYVDDRVFDVILADESPGHFSDLGAYFRKVHAMLPPGGRTLIRDLHFTHPRHAAMGRATVFINELFGDTANYRTLAQELTAANEAGLDLVGVRPIDIAHYQRTLAAWRANLREHRAPLAAIVGEADVRAFDTYLRVSQRALASGTMTTEVSIWEKRG
jgi:cyclopropane-fatty-acyl-phospholipid synthase